jgi:hypothetical protein
VDSPKLTFRIITPPSHGLLSRVKKVRCTLDGQGGSICTARVIYYATPHFIGVDSFTYKANDGTNDSNLATVTINLVPPFTTFTQGAWGAPAKGNNVGTLLNNNFSSLYPGGVSIGGSGGGSSYKLTFTSATAVGHFLPTGGKAGVLIANGTNVTTSKAGVFAGNVLALQFNVDFSAAGISRSGLGAQKLTSGKLKNYTVSQVLALANQVLGGNTAALPAGVTLSDLNEIVGRIDDNYDSGREDEGFLIP